MGYQKLTKHVLYFVKGKENKKTFKNLFDTLFIYTISDKKQVLRH